MLTHDGAATQPGLELPHPNPAPEHAFTTPLRGTIAAVYSIDDVSNQVKQTVVDVRFLDGSPTLMKVPILRSRSSGASGNGEEISPEIGDLALVEFISGNFRDAIVTGFIPFNRNTIDAKTSDTPSRYLRENGFEEEIDANGHFTLRHKSGTLVRIGPDDTPPSRMSTATPAPAAGFYIKHPSGTEVKIDPDGTIRILGSGDIYMVGTGNVYVSGATVRINDV